MGDSTIARAASDDAAAVELELIEAADAESRWPRPLRPLRAPRPPPVLRIFDDDGSAVSAGKESATAAGSLATLAVRFGASFCATRAAEKNSAGCIMSARSASEPAATVALGGDKDDEDEDAIADDTAARVDDDDDDEDDGDRDVALEVKDEGGNCETEDKVAECTAADAEATKEGA